MTGPQFENYVHNLYQALGYRLEHNILAAGQQVDLMATKYLEGIGPIRILIECKYKTAGSVSNQEVHELLAFLNAHPGVCDKAILVTNSSFSTSAKTSADSSHILSLQSLKDLETRLFDPAEPFFHYCAEYEDSAIFDEYINISATRLHPNTGLPDPHRDIADIPCVTTFIQDCLETVPPVLTTVLGDYGAGKTTLMRHTKYLAAKRFLQGRSYLRPLFFPLRDLHRHANLGDYIQTVLATELMRPIPAYFFWRFVEAGHFLILLDGFDEMAADSSIEVRKEAFLSIAPLVGLGSPVILTCRPGYFVSRQEYLDALKGIGLKRSAARLRDVDPPVTGDDIKRSLRAKFTGSHLPRTYALGDGITVSLNTLTEPQIDAFLRRQDRALRAQLNVGWEDVKRFILGVYDLRDLLTRPILLQMVVHTILEGALEINDTSLKISAVTLYRVYTELYLEIDWEKGPVRRFLQKAVRMAFAEAIALTMFRGHVLEIDITEIKRLVVQTEELDKAIRAEIKALSVDEVVSDLQVCAFLTRTGDDKFRFLHKSFMEFFVAQRLVRSLGSQSGRDGFNDVLTKEILYFVGGFALEDLAFRGLLLRRLRQSVAEVKGTRSTGIRGAEARNCFAAMVYSGELEGPLQIESVNLSGADWIRTTLRDIEFVRCVIERCRWRDMSLAGCRFTDVRMSSVTCEIASLVQVNMSVYMRDCAMDRMEILYSHCSFEGRGCMFDRLVCRQAEVKISGEWLIKRSEVVDTRISAFGGELSKLHVEDSEFTRCTVDLLDCGGAEGSVIRRSQFIDSKIALFVQYRDVRGCTLTKCEGVVILRDDQCEVLESGEVKEADGVIWLSLRTYIEDEEARRKVHGCINGFAGRGLERMEKLVGKKKSNNEPA